MRLAIGPSYRVFELHRSRRSGAKKTLLHQLTAENGMCHEDSGAISVVLYER